jgi:hypothetical protein
MGTSLSASADPTGWRGPYEGTWSGETKCADAATDPTPGGGDNQDDGTNCDDPNRIGCGSPIIIDLGAQSHRLTSLDDGVVFDLRNEGIARRVAWTRAGVDNAFLALDRNGNGVIDNGGELFGNYTRLRSGRNAQHGFEALSELDDDRDGLVDRSDSAWAALLLWSDRNHDGISEASELTSIGASHVSALETECQYIGRRDRWGNMLRYMAHARFTEGRRAYYDVFVKLGS